MGKKIRLQIDVTEERMAAIDDLVKLMGLSTRKALFDNSLTLLEWAANQKMEGKIIASISGDSDSYRELCIPCLENIKII